MRATNPTLNIFVAAFLCGCASTDSDKKKSVERGPDGTIAYLVHVETSEPGARIEAQGEYIGTSPTTLKIFGDEDGTFHNFGRFEFVVTAFPLKQGQFAQTKTFRTGGWFTPEDRVPTRIYFDMNLAPAGVPLTAATGNPPKQESRGGTGTGFVICPEGKVITAYHVVEGARQVRVEFADGAVVVATVAQFDIQNDVALIETRLQREHFVKLVSARLAKTGDRVFTLGFPVVTALGKEIKFTSGDISSLSGLRGSQSLIQITAPLQPGNSGGPLFLENGTVVGIVTSSAAIPRFLNYTGTLPQNVNWAVKSDYALPLFDQPKIAPAFDTTDKELLKKAVCFIVAE